MACWLLWQAIFPPALPPDVLYQYSSANGRAHFSRVPSTVNTASRQAPVRRKNRQSTSPRRRHPKAVASGQRPSMLQHALPHQQQQQQQQHSCLLASHKPQTHNGRKERLIVPDNGGDDVANGRESAQEVLSKAGEY